MGGAFGAAELEKNMGNKDVATNAIINLERQANRSGSAIEEISGHRICCRVKHQNRGGQRIPIAYFEIDGKRAKRAEVYGAIGI